MPSGLSRVALAAEAGEELAGLLVEHLHPRMGGVSDQQMPVLAEGEVLDVLELAFSGALRADVEHVLELDLGARLGHPAERKGERGARDRTPGNEAHSHCFLHERTIPQPAGERLR